MEDNVTGEQSDLGPYCLQTREADEVAKYCFI